MISVSNAGAEPLMVWIEPWCDELYLAPRSTILFTPVAPPGSPATSPTIDVTDDRLVFWAGGSGTMIVTIDGVEQETGSRIIPLSPALFDAPIKRTIGILFGGHPDARPGGAAVTARPSLWSRLFGHSPRTGTG